MAEKIFDDDRFRALPLSERTRIATNYFNREVGIGDEYNKLSNEDKTTIYNNFLKSNTVDVMPRMEGDSILSKMLHIPAMVPNAMVQMFQPTETSVAAAAKRGFSRFAAGVNSSFAQDADYFAGLDNVGSRAKALLGEVSTLAKTNQKVWENVYNDANQEVLKPETTSSLATTSGKVKGLASELGHGAVEMLSDPFADAAMIATEGFVNPITSKLLPKVISNPVALETVKSAINGSSGFVAYDEAQNILENTNHDLWQSAGMGAGMGVFGAASKYLLGSAVSKLLGDDVKSRREVVQDEDAKVRNLQNQMQVDNIEKVQQEADATARANQARVADDNSPIDINDLRNGIDAEIEVSKSVTPQEPSVSNLESRSKEFNKQRLEEENNPLNLNQNIVDSIKKNGGLTDYQKKVLGLTDKDIEPYLSEEQVKANEAKATNTEPMKEQVEGPTPIEKEKLKTAEEVKNEMQPTAKEEVSVEPTQEYKVNPEGISKEDYANLSVENKFKETMALVNKMKDMSDRLKEVAKGISQKDVMSEIKSYLGEHPAFEDAMAIFKSKEPKFEPLNKPEVKKQTVSNPEMKELNDLAQHPYFEEHLNERANVESKDTKYAQKKVTGRQYNQNGEVIGGALFEPNYDARFGITKRDVNAIRNALKTNKMNKVAQEAISKLKNDLELRTRESGSLYEEMQNKINGDKVFSNTERTLKEKLAHHLAEKADPYAVEGQRTIREATETLNRIGKERDEAIASGVDRQQAIKEVSDNISEITGADAEATAKKVESAYITADDIFNCGV